MCDETHKVVFVELEQFGAAAPIQNLQVKFQTSDANTYDRTLLLNAIKVKKPKMADLLSRGEVVFHAESEIFPGKFIEIGEDSPIKNKCVLKCFVTKPLDFDKPVSNFSNDRTTENPIGNNKNVILFCTFFI